VSYQKLIPPLGFGTYGRTGATGIEALLFALETGYRHLDTAQSYDTEVECGAALKQSGLRRDEVFLTTKIDTSNCRPGRLIPSLRKSLDNLGIDQVDLTLIHWPVDPHGALDKAAYLPDLVEAQALGLTRLIGVSNFTIADLEASRPFLDGQALATNQFERHPYLQNKQLVKHCTDSAIAVTCYLPLARGACAGDPVVEAIAKAHDATPHQIALAFSLAQGHVVIPTSGKAERITENFGASAIRLSDSEISAIESLDRNGRQINPSWSPRWD
jgi:2,5-diketo-D-gluconate reductase B